LAHPLNAFGVEPVHWLVKQERGRVAEECGGDAEPLAHAEREPAGAAMGDIREADELEYVVDSPAVEAVGVS
jgi:hypothetical protein